MLLELIKHGTDFLAANPLLVGAVIAAEEFLKKWLGTKAWVKRWHKIAAAFLLATLFVLPEFPPEFSAELLAEIVAVGGVAAGLFSAVSAATAPKK